MSSADHPNGDQAECVSGRNDNVSVPQRAQTEVEMHEQEFIALYGRLPNGYQPYDASQPCTKQDCLRLFFTALQNDPVNSPSAPRSALCLSGGGIRSATFALGVIQALARHGILKNFTYLSTVSGGGYIGGWLSAWCHRSSGIEEVETALKGSGRSLAAESPQVRHLRDYSNYLTPRVGLLRADVWTLIATYLRNLFLNTFILLPLLTAVLLLPRLYMDLLQEFPETRVDFTGQSWLDPLACVLVFLLIIAVLVLSFAGIVGLVTNLPAIQRRPNKALGTKPILAITVFPVFLSAFALSLLYCWQHTPVDYSQVAIISVLYYFAAAVTSVCLNKSISFLRLCAVLLPAGLITAAVSSYLHVVILPNPLGWIRAYATFGVPALLFLNWLLIALYVGFTSARPGGDDDREWLGRIMAWLMLVQVVWIACFVIALGGPFAVHAIQAYKRANGRPIFPTHILAFISLFGLSLGGIGAKLSVASNAITSVSGALRRLSNKHFQLVLKCTAALAIIILFMCLATVADDTLMVTNNWIPKHHLNFFAPHLVTLLFILVLSAVGVASGYMTNSNRLSLHAIYRDRIIRAYLGASRIFKASSGPAAFAAERHPNPFTGFDPRDNLPVHHLRRSALYTAADFNDVPADASTEQRPSRPKALVDCLLRADRNYLRHIGFAKHPFLLKSDLPPDQCVQKLIYVFNYLLHEKSLVDDSADYRSQFRNGPRSHTVFEMEQALARIAEDGCFKMFNRLYLDSIIQFAVDGGACATTPQPFHIINTSLNLAGTDKFATRERKAESFTISALHCGYRDVYRPSVDFASAITMGTALTISGAAASPNMGYHSSPIVTFLMTLFNVRLGWWLGNPASDETYTYRDAHHPLQTFLSEALGQTDDRYKYVYLSDGGHFENLGLYEMVRRRCRYIVAIDASCEPRSEFSDLANAIRKIEIDLNITVHIEKSTVLNPELDCAIGTIEYKDADGKIDPGTLIYIRPARQTKIAIVDIFNYTRLSADFPHESTADQWFSEAQFESYRKLGLSTIEKVFENGKSPKDLPGIVGFAQRVADVCTASKAATDLNTSPLRDTLELSKLLGMTSGFDSIADWLLKNRGNPGSNGGGQKSTRRESTASGGEESNPLEESIKLPDGQVMQALIVNKDGWLEYQRFPGDLGKISFNPAHPGPVDGKANHPSGDAQPATVPRAGAYPAETVRRALLYFRQRHVLPKFIVWRDASA